MKKVILVLTLCMGLFAANAQTGFEAGVDVGIPVGDVKDGSSFEFGLNLAYMWGVSDNFNVGLGGGYDMFIAKDYEITVGGVTTKFTPDSWTYIPLYGAVKFKATDNFFLGANVGYAIGIGDSAKGGFLYTPKIGYSASNFDLYGYYKGIADSGATASAVGVGFVYKFGGN